MTQEEALAMMEEAAKHEHEYDYDYLAASAATETFYRADGEG